MRKGYLIGAPVGLLGLGLNDDVVEHDWAEVPLLETLQINGEDSLMMHLVLYSSI